MTTSDSPLRYPGGKQILGRILAYLILLNRRQGGIYVEPYCGGAGAALGLLYNEYVGRLMLNDADLSIYSFWRSVLDDTEGLLQLVRDTPLTVDEWLRQRAIYRDAPNQGPLALGFATFYLNRCNRSGIVAGAGLIGGLKQTGPYKLDARFNRAELARRIDRVASYRSRIKVYNLDAIDFLREHVCAQRIVESAFVYLDPPYYEKGSELYLNHYAPPDHKALATFLRPQEALQWVMTYDNAPQVLALYPRLRRIPFDLSYSARERRVGREVMILKQGLVFPHGWGKRIPDHAITASDSVPLF